MKNKELEKYIIDLKNKKKRLEFELAEVNDELYSITSAASAKSKNVNSHKCPICDGKGEYNDRWAGFVSCPECKGTGYKPDKKSSNTWWMD